MKISIWVVEVGVCVEDIDSTFNWESNTIPLIGDSITYEMVGKYCHLPIYGVVVERTFYAGEDLVSLNISISEKDAERISNYLDETSGKLEHE